MNWRVSNSSKTELSDLCYITGNNLLFLMDTFIQQGWMKLDKRENKDVNSVTKYFSQ